MDLAGWEDLPTAPEAPVRVAGVPNARLRGESEDPGDDAIDPEDVARWAAERGLRALLTWSESDAFHFDAVLVPDSDDHRPVAGLCLAGDATTSDPTWAEAVRRHVDSTRTALAETLPAYMVP
ncbi:hypothetical protein, partial [Actinoalloteichus caeruleus]|uniref:hypothetical protein n=1 Tax=Actinoalloteichus cyanogriseus TaxID=2893586 RepID=UPI00138DF778